MTSPFVAPDLNAPRLSHIVSSPIGRLLLLGDGHALTGLWMVDADRHSALVEMGLTPSPATFPHRRGRILRKSIANFVQR